MPEIIVTDQSWALINSVLKSFNNCDINHYINWCFSRTVNENFVGQCPNVILYLCSTHFLKNVIKKSKQIDVGKNICKAFNFMFALVQNSVNIEQINLYLKHIYTILNSERLDGKKNMIYKKNYN